MGCAPNLPFTKVSFVKFFPYACALLLATRHSAEVFMFLCALAFLRWFLNFVRILLVVRFSVKYLLHSIAIFASCVCVCVRACVCACVRVCLYFLLLQFVAKLGLKPTWQFTDVYGLEPELLAMVPQPVCALLVLFPCSEKVW